MTLKYPEQVDTTTADYMIFTAHKYSVNNNVGGSRMTPPSRPKELEGKDNLSVGPVVGEPVILYMPSSTPGITNTNGWQEDRSFAGAWGAIKRDFGVTVAGAGMDAGSMDTQSPLTLNKGNALDKAGPAAVQVGVTALASMLNTSPTTLTALARGKIFNPNVEMIYQGPAVRAFQFDFVFVPKSEKEGQIVNKIIKQFKVLSSAKVLSQAYFEIPHLWLVRYMTRDQLNKNMNRFKRAALTNIAVQANQGFDYHSSYQDGMPITTSMSLQFTEVDIITREDHENTQTLQGF
jgi:hypothetical protein